MHILHEDADFLAVNKPAGLATIPGRTEPESVMDQLARQLARRDRLAEPPKLLVVHRLDRDTSGVLLVARHTDAQRKLTSQFGKRTVGKVYWALVAGTPDPAEGEIAIALEPDPDRPGAMKPTRRRSRTKAVSQYRVLEEFRGLSLVEVRPVTGRPHQIRVHFQAIGHPLAVDPIYGSAEGLMLSRFKAGFRLKRGDRERPLIARLTLHALRVGFARPSDGQPMEVEAPLPKDFRATLEALRKWAAVRRPKPAARPAATAPTPVPAVPGTEEDDVPEENQSETELFTDTEGDDVIEFA
jgi:RluA family pseudouridine synthase